MKCQFFDIESLTHIIPSLDYEVYNHLYDQVEIINKMMQLPQSNVSQLKNIYAVRSIIEDLLVPTNLVYNRYFYLLAEMLEGLSCQKRASNFNLFIKENPKPDSYGWRAVKRWLKSLSVYMDLPYYSLSEQKNQINFNPFPVGGRLIEGCELWQLSVENDYCLHWKDSKYLNLNYFLTSCNLLIAFEWDEQNRTVSVHEIQNINNSMARSSQIYYFEFHILAQNNLQNYKRGEEDAINMYWHSYEEYNQIMYDGTDEDALLYWLVQKRKVIIGDNLLFAMINAGSAELIELTKRTTLWGLDTLHHGVLTERYEAITGTHKVAAIMASIQCGYLSNWVENAIRQNISESIAKNLIATIEKGGQDFEYSRNEDNDADDFYRPKIWLD